MKNRDKFQIILTTLVCLLPMTHHISNKMFSLTQKNSAVREMFEEGNRLAALYGRENVYDFSLGNPYFPAPEKVKDSIFDILENESSTMWRQAFAPTTVTPPFPRR